MGDGGGAPELRGPNAYSDAQDLIAAGIVRRTFRFFVVGLALLAGGLAWLGYDFREDRGQLLDEIRGFRSELESEVNRARETASAIDRAAVARADTLQRLSDRLAEMDGLIDRARALPSDVLSSIIDQTSLTAAAAADASTQAQASRDLLAELS